MARKSHPNRQEDLVLLQCHQGRRLYREARTGGEVGVVYRCITFPSRYQVNFRILGTLEGSCNLLASGKPESNGLSSAEAELIALSEGAQLLRSVKTTLEDMGIRPEMCELRVDATAAIAVASSGGSWRTRHLRLREHWLSELVNSDEYQLMHQPGLDQLADG